MIQALTRPNKKFLPKSIRFFKERLCEPDGGYLDHFQDDWGSLVATQRLASWVTLLPESKVGKFLLVRFNHPPRTKKDTNMLHRLESKRTVAKTTLPATDHMGESR